MTDIVFDLYLLAAALGLVPVVAFAGLPVLSQSAFLAVGAIGAMQLERAGLPIGSALILSIAGGAALGALTGWLVAKAPAPRVALATWGLAWLAAAILVAAPDLSGGTQGLTRPALDRVATPLFELTLTPTVHLVTALVLVAAALVISERIRRGPIGRDALALREDREVAAELGVPITHHIVTLFALAAAFGAAGGAGFTLLIGVAAPADLSPLLALQLFAAVIVGGGAPIAGPLLALLVLAGVPRAASLLAETGLSTDAANGVMTAAALVACLWLRPHVAARIRRRPPRPVPPGPQPEPTTASFTAQQVTDPLGILKGVDVALASGELHALVGPNGSGKTTLLRTLAARDERVARTFQRPAPLTPLTPYEQVLLARRDDPLPILELTELADRAHATDLGPGEERLLQIARTVATGKPILLLDEPAAGMTAAEREALLRVLARLKALDRAVLVVEHDLDLLSGVADKVTRLDAGRVRA
ncbi:ATP-binding cassette domain-containing protein [Solirubrobacter sp. CPCC 204708]|uniref:ATP-binding cassette domain-containing protein n=1 Tax=Solirubrobacter deserti TaxID=2282478 RepID=A0ABT4RP00_9ACTN|nr:ATP-binding cassette domain-containing protein [Solirubrobacter deserti]MBE2317541.1 ATP-binding cassette domain-containing protein [Solirubrobacter deserti]MDA0140283.1 ATP-binding cassette domain-containing protein [Solirubrobacter deserti]